MHPPTRLDPVPSAQPEISVILNVHREAFYLARTLRSLHETIVHAQQAGASCELVIVLDNSDEATTRLVEDWNFGYVRDLQVLKVANRSLAHSRNDGCRHARGRYISLHDADDLYSYNYLTAKWTCARQHERAIVVPEYLVGFDAQAFITAYASAHPLTIFSAHPYISQILAPRELYAELSYVHPDAASRRAYEDWHFNCGALALGWRFEVARDTSLYYRQRAGSIMSQARREGRRWDIMRSELFEPETFLRTQAATIDQPQPDIKPTPRRTGLWSNEVFVKTMLAANAIDPLVDIKQLGAAPFYLNTSSSIEPGRAYYRACEQVRGKSFTDVFIVPGFSAGGGEKYMRQIIDSLLAQRADRDILMIAGESPAQRDWVHLLPSQVTFVDLATAGLDMETSAFVAFRLAEHSGPPQRIFLKPCRFSNHFLAEYGDQLNHTSINYFRWCDESTSIFEQDVVSPELIRAFENNIDSVDRLVCDCEAIAQQDRSRILSQADKWVVLKSYVELASVPVLRERKQFERKLVWASRFDRQKRPTLLLSLSALLAQDAELHDITISVHTVANKPWQAARAFQGRTQIRFKGPYQTSFSEVEPWRYDALLYTSLYDGIPNVIVEAMGHGLPVIAGDTGGVAECVQTDRTGHLITQTGNDEKDALAYLEAIRGFYRDLERAKQLGEGAWHLVQAEHGLQTHRDRLVDIFGLEQKGGGQSHA